MTDTQRYMPLATLITENTSGDNNSRVAMLATGDRETGTIIMFIGDIKGIQPSEGEEIKDHLIETGIKLDLKQFEAVRQMFKGADRFLTHVQEHLSDKLSKDFTGKALGLPKNRDN